MKTHRDLEVWQRSMRLVQQIYQFTSNFPNGERFGLTSQMRRAAVSIPSNIAEGAARGTTREFCYFLRIARGSLAELETQVIVSVNLGCHEKDSLLSEEIQSQFKMINSLISSLKKSERSSSSTPRQRPITNH